MCFKGLWRAQGNQLTCNQYNWSESLIISVMTVCLFVCPSGWHIQCCLLCSVNIPYKCHQDLCRHFCMLWLFLSIVLHYSLFTFQGTKSVLYIDWPRRLKQIQFAAHFNVWKKHALRTSIDCFGAFVYSRHFPTKEAKDIKGHLESSPLQLGVLNIIFTLRRRMGLPSGLFPFFISKMWLAVYQKEIDAS